MPEAFRLTFIDFFQFLFVFWNSALFLVVVVAGTTMRKLANIIGIGLVLSILFGVVVFAPGWQPVGYTATASNR
jgi:hypothetical protein